MASRISRRSRCNSASLSRFIFTRAEAWLLRGGSRESQWSLSSPARSFLRWKIGACEVAAWIAFSTQLSTTERTLRLLNLHGAFNCDQLNRTLLRISRVDLHNRELRIARRERLDHDRHNGTSATDARRIWRSGDGNNFLAVRLVRLLHDGSLGVGG